MLHTLPGMFHMCFQYILHTLPDKLHTHHYILHTLPDMFLTFAGAYSQCMFSQCMLSLVVILSPLFFSLGPNKSAGSSLKINSPSSMSLVATQPNPRPANDSSLYMFMGKNSLGIVEICPKLCVPSIFVIQSCDDACSSLLL